MEDNSFILDSFTWSFSRINSFSGGCKKEWKEHYIDCEDLIDSFDGQCGGITHKTLEKYFKGELSEFDLYTYFEENYPKEVTYPCPYPSGDSKYPKILNYFENFSFDHNKYEVLGVEKEIKIKLRDKYDVVGYIDLLLKNKETGEIILCDHKTSTIKVLKNGNISKTDAEHFLAFKRQQYLYSYAVLQEYKRVDILEWNMVKDGTMIKIPWSKEEMDEVLDWAYNTIVAIEKENEYPTNPDYYYCHNLCSVRENCPYKRLGSIFNSIKNKCCNPKAQGYEDFGGAGIGICDEWMSSPMKFYEWSLSHGYDDTLVLRRYDYDADYSPENCFWTTKEDEEYYGEL